MSFEVKPYGNQGFLVQFSSGISKETHLKVRLLYEQLRTYAQQGVKGLIPAYDSLLVLSRPELGKLELENWCNQILSESDLDSLESYKVIIPVCYDDEFALDMKAVQNASGLSHGEIVELHANTTYLNYMLGFVPGFLYLGGMDKRLSTPRLENPRVKIPSGSVAIAGEQTGVYPLETPGGWNIIGRTPVSLFDPEVGMSVQMGDYVCFQPITKKEFKHWEAIKPKRTILK